jgi:uncharacterized protein YceH (UPF0502 family)
MGAGLVRASTKYLQSSEAKPLMESITKAQTERLERWKKYAHLFKGETALAAEEKCLQKSISEKQPKEASAKP